ncbi:integrase core domain-containing protein [Phthorimaea operculella]|nr:integrase core domain-containing protein [Phthorimaea operculella]
MARQDAEELKQAISNAFSLFGIPKLLVADRGRMFEARSFVSWLSEMGCDIHHITPEMHQSNGQVERYVRTLLNMIRIQAESNHDTWSGALWRLQLVLNITKQKTTQTSPLNLLVGIDGATPVIRSLVRDVAADGTRPNREAWREMCRTRANELLRRNRTQQDTYVNQKRHPARVFQVGDFVFVIKYSQSTGKLDPGMRGPYRVQRALPCGRYELKLLGGSYGKSTQAAAEYMVPWRGEWCPEACAAFFDNEEEEDEPTAGPSSASVDLEQTSSSPGMEQASDEDYSEDVAEAASTDDETTSNVTATDLLGSDGIEGLLDY